MIVLGSVMSTVAVAKLTSLDNPAPDQFAKSCIESGIAVISACVPCSKAFSPVVVVAVPPSAKSVRR